MDVLFTTMAGRWQRTHTTNSTATSFATRNETLVQPVGEGIIEMSGNSEANAVPNGITMLFFGTSADNQNFNARVLGWDFSLVAGVQVWNYVMLCQFAVTLGNLAGAAGGEITTTGFVADTIALTYGNDDVSVDIVSPANDIRAHAVIDAKGFRKLEVLFDRNSSAASCNCLYRKL